MLNVETYAFEIKAKWHDWRMDICDFTEIVYRIKARYNLKMYNIIFKILTEGPASCAGRASSSPSAQVDSSISLREKIILPSKTALIDIISLLLTKI